MELEAAQLLQQTAHPALVKLPSSEFTFVCFSQNEKTLSWDSKTIHEWKSKLLGHKGRSAPTALLHLMVSNLAEVYRVQVSCALADGKPLNLPVPSAPLAPQRVVSDIVLASLSAVLHSHKEFQLRQVVFSVEEASMQRALAKACERLRTAHADFHGGEAKWTCVCNRCGGAHDTLSCPNFVQSHDCDPDAQLRAEAFCRNSTPNATLLTSRYEREQVSAKCEASSPKNAASHKVESVTGYQQLPHGDDGPLSSPKDCYLSPKKYRKVAGNARRASDFCMTQPANASEPGNGSSCDQKRSALGSGERCYDQVRRPKPAGAHATPLQLLELQSGFSDQDLRNAYKKAVLQWHPDRPLWQGASEKDLQEAADMFRRIKEAYDVLSKRGAKAKA